MISFVIFVIGFFITISYVFFYIFNKKEEDRKSNKFSIRDDIDYDGHGNWGRFPPLKEKKSKFINFKNLEK